jgi:Holliday junction resolvase RusA-like endonuclease
MKIIIDGIPVPKSRHRCACTGKNKPHAYDPQSSHEMKDIRQRILLAWNSAFNNPSSEIYKDAIYLTKATSFVLRYTFIFPIPRSNNQRQINAKLWGLEEYNSKPDLDNLTKLYTDCATGIIWDDDAQIVELRSKKFYGEKPRTIMEIMVKKEFNPEVIEKNVLLAFGPDRMKDFLRDVNAFWAWSPERIEENSLEKGDKTLIAHFAFKYGEDLNRVAKLKPLHPANETMSKMIELGDIYFST